MSGNLIASLPSDISPSLSGHGEVTQKLPASIACLQMSGCRSQDGQVVRPRRGEPRQQRLCLEADKVDVSGVTWMEDKGPGLPISGPVHPCSPRGLLRRRHELTESARAQEDFSAQCEGWHWPGIRIPELKHEFCSNLLQALGKPPPSPGLSVPFC